MLLSTLRNLLRRWYVLVGGLLATAGLCWLAATAVPASYETTASVLLLPPQRGVNGVIVNPYLSLGGLEGVADVVTTAMTDNATAQALEDAGIGAEFTMDRDRALAGPIITVTVDGRTAPDALRAQEFLLARVPVSLEEIQVRSDVSAASQVRSTTITSDVEPASNRKGQIRALIVAFAVGIGLTLMTAALVEGFTASRRRSFGPGKGAESLRAA